MKTILQFMGEDHDRLDAIFKEFSEAKRSDARRAKSFFHEFKTGLQRHIVWEEEILFPLFESKTGMENDGPTAVMREEHKQIRGFLERIHENLQSDSASTEDAENGLIGVLTDHNNKEEGILYPWIDQSVSEEEKAEVFAKIENLPPEKYSQCCNPK
jgi:iron-sulfur cluster repair protein YtfE (RIC family)